VTEHIAGKDKIAEYFEGLLERHGDHYLSLDWKSKESQLLRFSVLLDILSFAKKKQDFSILDVGCGLGHFYEFLLNTSLINNMKISYTGIDISKKMVDFAKRKFPAVNFQTMDIIGDKLDRKFDYVVSSGIFNVKMADLKTHKESVRKMISRMYQMSRFGTSINFMVQSAVYLVPQDRDPDTDKYVFFSEEEVVFWVKPIAERYVLRRDYYPGDFTVYMLK
jgi:SAM-dependent methyltransferase